MTGVISEKNNTVDYDTLDKTSSAKSKTRKRRLSNVNAKEVNDDCNGDYCLTCDESKKENNTRGCYKRKEKLQSY